MCIAASIPQRMATPHCRGSYQTPEIGRSLRDRDSISLEAGSLERRLDSQEIRNRKWAEQLNASSVSPISKTKDLHVVQRNLGLISVLMIARDIVKTVIISVSAF